MADYLPQATGNWSTTTWITAVGGLSAFAGGNTPPTVIDDVYADGKTITVNIDTAVNSLRTTTSPRTGGLAGGGFTVNSGISLSAASIIAGTTTCLTFGSVSPNACTIVGNVSGSATAVNTAAVNNSSSGIINFFGRVQASPSSSGFGITNTSGTINFFGTALGGGATNAFGINNSSTGTVNLSGTLIGGSGGTAHGITNPGSGTVNITGTVIGGTISTTFGINNSLNATVNVIGTVIGGSAGAGINNSSTGTINVTGIAVGGSGATAGVNNTSTGRVFIYGTASGGTGTGSVGANNAATSGFIYAQRAVGNGWGLGSVGITGGGVGLANVQNGLVYVEQVEFGPRGQTPISGPVYILPSNRNTLVGYTTALGTPVTFYNSLSVDGLLPPVSSVQAGVVYNVGNSVGTMAVPSASAVQFGVPVDNTIGTAALQPQDVWGYARLSATQVDSMGDRLRNTATTQSIGYQIASFNL